MASRPHLPRALRSSRLPAGGATPPTTPSSPGSARCPTRPAPSSTLRTVDSLRALRHSAYAQLAHASCCRALIAFAARAPANACTEDSGWPNPPAAARYIENFPSDAIVNALFRPGTATRTTTDACKSGSSRPTLNLMVQQLTPQQPRNPQRRKHRTATDPRPDAGNGAGKSGPFQNAGVLRARDQPRPCAGAADQRSQMRSRPLYPLLASASHVGGPERFARNFRHDMSRRRRRGACGTRRPPKGCATGPGRNMVTGI